ncbi:MAG: hypothetical protein IJT77_12045 [Clostridia bacterium]|nr:hypothetical protein [Clostridia bacterium]
MSYAQVRTENFAGVEDAWRALKTDLWFLLRKPGMLKSLGEIVKFSDRKKQEIRKYVVVKAVTLSIYWG